MPSKATHPGIWPLVYRQMRSAGAGAYIPWTELETIMDRGRMHSRAALTRARQELERVDGLTIVDQDKDGITLGAVR